MPSMEQLLCQPRNWNPGRIFLSNFKTKHSRPREKGLERSVETDTGGVKKDTCGGSLNLGSEYKTRFAPLSAQPLRCNAPNHQGSDKDGAKECRETKGYEDVALNKAYKHDGNP